MLKILNTAKDFVRNIADYTDLKVERELETGDETLSFTCFGPQDDIQNEFYVVTKRARYVVKEISPEPGRAEYVCKLDLEDLEAEMLLQFTAANTSCLLAARAAVTGTGWRVEVSGDVADKIRSVQQFKKSPLSILYSIRDAFMCEIAFDTIQEVVTFRGKIGEDKGVYFRPELNLVSLSPTFDSYDYYTRIIPIGADGLTIESINEGKNYVENYQYSNKIRTLIWEDTSYTDKQALKDDAIAKLADLSKPKRSYSANVRDLAKLSTAYSICEYGLGDIVHIVDEPQGVMDDQRIVKITEYPDSPEKNSIEISNTVLTWEELQAKLKAAADAWEDISNTDGTVNGVYVHGVQADEVVGIEVTVGGQTIENGSVSDLADAMMETQGAVSAISLRVGTIEADYLSAAEADLRYADIDFANLDTANINLAKVRDLFVTVGLIKNAAIQDAKITGYLDAVEVNAASITAGTLIADRIAIRGTNNSVVYALNDFTGAVQAANINTLNGEVLTPRTIDADKIIAGSITANEIAASTITASQIAAHTITATEITTNNLVGTNGWINLAEGTFNYGNGALAWNGSRLNVSGEVEASSGRFGGFYIFDGRLASENYAVSLYYSASRPEFDGITISRLFSDKLTIGNADGGSRTGDLIELRAYSNASDEYYGMISVLNSVNGTRMAYMNGDNGYVVGNTVQALNELYSAGTLESAGNATIGGRLTCNEYIYSRVTSGNAMLIARNDALTTANVGTLELQMQAQSTGYQGIHSNGYWDGSAFHADAKWLIYRNTAGAIGLNGNASTATKLATARTITIGNKSLNFDGSAALSFSLADIGAADKSVLGTFATAESSGTVNLTTKDVYTKIGTTGLTLTAGVWLIYGVLQDSIDATNGYHTFLLQPSNSGMGLYKTTAKVNMGTTATYSTIIFGATLSASTTYYGWLASSIAGKSGNCNLWLRAIRLK